MELQPQNNNLLLEWKREVAQDNTTPTSLSFCEAPATEKPDHHKRSPSNQDMFEFSNTLTNPDKFSPNAAPDHYIIFCGQFITQKESVRRDDHRQDKANTNTNTNTNAKQKPSNNKEARKASKSRPAAAGGRALRRYTSLQSSRPMLIGVGRNVKPARIEMRDIKERQKRMAAEKDSNHGVLVEKETAAAGELGNRSLVVVDGSGGDRVGKGHWNLLRTVGFRAYLSTALNKTSLGLGCFSVPAVAN